jgi:hypothetical protein
MKLDKWFFRKMFFLLAVLIALAGVARAEISVPDLINKIPENHQCLIYSISDSEFQYATTFTLAKVWKERISFDAGYSPSQEAIAAVSVKLIEVKDYIKFPILDLMEIEPMIWVGYDRIAIGAGNAKDNNEFNWGAGVKLIKLKF